MTPRSGSTLSIGNIREDLKKNLPDYMIPANLVVLDKFPFTTSGKIDTQALPDPSDRDAGPGEAYVAPASDTEKKMAAIWSRLLNIEKVGVSDNFFEIGGHSLLIARLTPRIKDEFHVDLPFRQFFETPTIEALSKVVEALLYLQDGPNVPPPDEQEAREDVEI